MRNRALTVLVAATSALAFGVLSAGQAVADDGITALGGQAASVTVGDVVVADYLNGGLAEVD